VWERGSLTVRGARVSVWEVEWLSVRVRNLRADAGEAPHGNKGFRNTETRRLEHVTHIVVVVVHWDIQS